jgi:hypothetical protein
MIDVLLGNWKTVLAVAVLIGVALETAKARRA